ncbi:unnamed protein product [Nesidiocoris tenuis]|uniref:Alpha-ketoglutarate-dependent dioxygenase AlkB-like domain-containing protein n=1 Tax=Nesidiocoris tenuis TaxID=355587 RepID=A0A6H5HMT5_9HEMI|nr:unnamed protein product [Nesidiocoris tenuis]
MEKFDARLALPPRCSLKGKGVPPQLPPVSAQTNRPRFPSRCRNANCPNRLMRWEEPLLVARRANPRSSSLFTDGSRKRSMTCECNGTRKPDPTTMLICAFAPTAILYSKISKPNRGFPNRFWRKPKNLPRARHAEKLTTSNANAPETQNRARQLKHAMTIDGKQPRKNSGSDEATGPPDEVKFVLTETEQVKWADDNLRVLDRVRATAFPETSRLLPHVHVLDLADNGWIKPHIDRYDQDPIIIGLSRSI